MNKAMQGALQAAIAHLSMLKFFPSDDFARAAIMQLIERMATAPEQVAWLAKTVVDNYNDWPGPHAMRAVFCTRYKPADGVEADLTEGLLASKIEARAIAAHQEHKALPLPAKRVLKELLP